MAQAATMNTPIGRASFAYLYAPKKNEKGDEKYSVSLLFPKKQTDMKALKSFMLKAVNDSDLWSGYEKGKVTIKGKKKPLTMPIKDGDRKFEDDDQYENYRGMWYIEFSSKYPPGLADRNRKDITDKEDVYSGMWGRVSCHCYCWKTDTGKHGVSFGLNNFQKTKNDTPFSSFQSAASAFDDDADLGDGDGDLDDGGMSYEDDDELEL